MHGSLMIIGSIACSALLMACSALDGGGDAEDTTAGSSSAVCEVTESGVAELDCGVFDGGSDECGATGGVGDDGDLASDAGTDGGGTDGGGTDGGGAGGGDECEVMNDAVVSCIIQAEADGVAFSFGYSTSTFGGQFSTSIGYHVAPDGSMWRRRQEFEDLCQSSDTTVYEPVDLSGCSDWACIDGIVGGASVVEVCQSDQNCDGI